jgi:hypothetical protein
MLKMWLVIEDLACLILHRKAHSYESILKYLDEQQVKKVLEARRNCCTKYRSAIAKEEQKMFLF